MQALATVSFSLAVIAYTIASTQFFLELARKRVPTGAEVPARFLALGALLHAGHIVAASLLTNICPVTSMHFALSLAGWVAVVAFLVFRRGRKLDALGSFVGPLSLTFLVAAQFIGDSPAPSELSSAMLALHITVNVVGLGFVLLAGGAASFYVFLEARLKSKRPLSVGRLPSLDQLDRLRHLLLLIGFPLLTVGVVTGGIFISQIDVGSFGSLARAAFGYAAWLSVAIVLSLRALLGWEARKSAYGTLAGVLCVSLVLLLYVLRPFFGGLV